MRYAMLAVLCLMAGSAHGQGKDCKRPHKSGRQLSLWIQQARTPEQLDEIACYLRTESTRYEVLAAGEEANLRDAREHNIGGSKYPSMADHARTYSGLYHQKALKYSTLARQLEARANHDAPAS